MTSTTISKMTLVVAVAVLGFPMVSNSQAPAVGLEILPQAYGPPAADYRSFQIVIDAPTGAWCSVLVRATIGAGDPDAQVYTLSNYPWLAPISEPLTGLNGFELSPMPSLIVPGNIEVGLASVADIYTRAIVAGQSVPVRKHLQPVTLSDATSTIPGNRKRVWDSRCESWVTYPSTYSLGWFGLVANPSDSDDAFPESSSGFSFDQTMASAIYAMAPSKAEAEELLMSLDFDTAERAGLSLVFQALVFENSIPPASAPATDNQAQALPQIAVTPPEGPKLRPTGTILVSSPIRPPNSGGGGPVPIIWWGEPYGPSANSSELSLGVPWSGFSLPLRISITMRGANYLLTGTPNEARDTVMFPLPPTATPGTIIRINTLFNSRGTKSASGQPWQFVTAF